jgi:hypothetical protein
VVTGQDFGYSSKSPCQNGALNRASDAICVFYLRDTVLSSLESKPICHIRWVSPLSKTDNGRGKNGERDYVSFDSNLLCHVCVSVCEYVSVCECFCVQC